MAEDRVEVLLLGVGNLLWADEGFGVRCVEEFASRHALPEGVAILDGGTQGLALVPHLARARRVILFDAVEYGAPPATLVVARDAEVPGYIAADKMSLHQAGVNDVLACVQLMGRSPDHLTLIGVQPVQLDDYGGSLTDAVRAQIEPAIAAAVQELRDWGFDVADAADGAPVATTLAAALSLDHYEAGRPPSASACRTGDTRVLQQALERIVRAEQPGGSAS
jgi:hydrogenase maturation protease